jgi:hypothetical protein
MTACEKCDDRDTGCEDNGSWKVVVTVALSTEPGVGVLPTDFTVVPILFHYKPTGLAGRRCTG